MVEAHKILVSAQGPLVFGFRVLGFRRWALYLNLNSGCSECINCRVCRKTEAGVREK